MIDSLHASILAGYSWLAVGLFFVLAEIGTPGLFYFLSFAFGSFCGACIAFLGYSIYTQCLSAIVISLISFALLRRYVSPLGKTKHKTNIDALVNQKALVIQTINPNDVGRIKIKGEEWPAITTLNTSFAPHSLVTIIGVQGNKLIVK